MTISITRKVTLIKQRRIVSNWASRQKGNCVVPDCVGSAFSQPIRDGSVDHQPKLVGCSGLCGRKCGREAHRWSLCALIKFPVACPRAQ